MNHLGFPFTKQTKANEKDHRIKAYNNLAQIGLTAGSETIESIVAALKDNSALYAVITGDYAAIYPSSTGALEVIRLLSPRIIFRFTGRPTGKIWTGLYDANNVSWSGWVPIATATPPEEHDLQLAAGITTYTRSKYFKSQDNVVTFYATVQKEAGFSNGALIATLPVGFRPSERIDFPATFSSNKDDGVRAPGFAMLNPNGKIQSAANGTGLNNAYIYGSFVAAD